MVQSSRDKRKGNHGADVQCMGNWEWSQASWEVGVEIARVSGYVNGLMELVAMGILSRRCWQEKGEVGEANEVDMGTITLAGLDLI